MAHLIDKQLSKLVFDGAKRLYGEPLTNEVKERIDFELQSISYIGQGHLLHLHEVINTTCNELGAMVGPGYGSAASSIVNYCLEITKIDPLRFGLLFERFLNPDENYFPDIHLELDIEGRKKVLLSSRLEELAKEGFLFAIFSQKALSIIKDTIENIRLKRHIEVDIDKIDITNPATYQLYCKGLTSDTFLFDSVESMNYMRQLQPSSFNELIAMSALYRPVVEDFIPEFIERKKGIKPIEYDIPIMENTLKETYGMMIYKEQLMLLSQQIANFTKGESDVLLRAIRPGFRPKLDSIKIEFIDRGCKNGYTTKVLEKILSEWEKKAPYLFQKSHATCYAWMAYQTTYLKANFPCEYRKVAD